MCLISGYGVMSYTALAFTMDRLPHCFMHDCLAVWLSCNIPLSSWQKRNTELPTDWLLMYTPYSMAGKISHIFGRLLLFVCLFVLVSFLLDAMTWRKVFVLQLHHLFH